MKGKKGKKRIFIGFHEIAGYFSQLKRGLIELETKADFYSFSQHIFKYSIKPKKTIHVLLLQWIDQLVTTNPDSAVGLNFLQLLRYKLITLIYYRFRQQIYDSFFTACVKKYDTFIFSYNSSFYPDFRDLEILTSKGKTIIYVYFGSDSRPAWMDGSIMAEDRGISIDQCKKLTEDVFEKIRIIERYSNYIICNPASAQFFIKPIVNWFDIGFPTKVTPHIGVKKNSGQLQECCKILHSPSHPLAKGTPVIERVIEELNNEGYNIELIKIVNQPNEVVLKMLREVDLAVDQLYSDTPLAGFATEAVSQGTPVLIGGYFKDFLKQVITNDLAVNIFNPEDLKNQIIGFICDPEPFYQQLQIDRQFLQDKWNAKTIASLYLKMIDGDLKDTFFINPLKTGVIAPCVMSNDRFLQIVIDFYKTYGIEGFNLHHNAILENEILSLIDT